MRESEQRHKLLKNKKMYIQRRSDGIQKNFTVGGLLGFGKTRKPTRSD